MKIVQKIIPILVLSTLFACSRAERKGLAENERAYVTDAVNDSCVNEFKYVANDLILELKNISLDRIELKAKEQLDSVYGSIGVSNYFEPRLKKDLIKNYFSLENKIKDSLVVIGSNNLWNIENPMAFFDSNSVHPRKLDWKKTILCNSFEATTVNHIFGKWSIEQKIVPCIKSNWKETGQFKKFTRSKDVIDISPSYQYQLEIDFNIHLSITNSETSKKEHYVTSVTDVCKGYSSANFVVWYKLNGIKPPSATNNEHKKIEVMRTLKKSEKIQFINPFF
ncbi:hypothetical protein KORDIASMS9_02574 [Kordia sp. SMS9]|uniref:hypothetical protein n=1 Tax=Kordia sp. SMS9 TaxID=2282170 RepID=UPI000E0DB8B7|nr:hypothetical protein [Kordia sp. SMS9]AXG70335.1 hypothetical protein KORDIASMS9_02574 [Kordia sp. SMS9]